MVQLHFFGRCHVYLWVGDFGLQGFWTFALRGLHPTPATAPLPFLRALVVRALRTESAGDFRYFFSLFFWGAQTRKIWYMVEHPPNMYCIILYVYRCV